MTTIITTARERIEAVRRAHIIKRPQAIALADGLDAGFNLCRRHSLASTVDADADADAVITDYQRGFADALTLVEQTLAAGIVPQATRTERISR